MPWLKTGDNAATHPNVMALATVSGVEDCTINEVFGFVSRCATQSAGHMTDYRIDLGTAQLLGGPRTAKLLRQAVAAGLMIQHGSGRSRTWEIVEDDDLFHIRRREEVQWDRQRKRDAANPELTVPVRVRDGDACRYCGNVVYWSNRRGGRGGTYDHREPGRPATPDTYVVCCRSCNSSRKDLPDADERMPLLPAPDQPIYTPQTVKWLASHGIPVTPTDARPGDGPGVKRDPAPRDTARTSSPAPDVAVQRDLDRRAEIPRAARPGETSPDTAQSSRPGGHAPDTAPTTRGIAQPADGGVAKRDPASRRDTARTSSPAPDVAVQRDPASGRDTARPARPDQPSDTAQSSRPGAPTPDTAPPIWGPDANGPPAWARPDLQKPADPSRKEGYGPGRVGSGRAGPGAARSAPVSLVDSSASRRRARRSRRRD